MRLVLYEAPNCWNCFDVWWIQKPGKVTSPFFPAGVGIYWKIPSKAINKDGTFYIHLLGKCSTVAAPFLPQLSCSLEICVDVKGKSLSRTKLNDGDGCYQIIEYACIYTNALIHYSHTHPFIHPFLYFSNQQILTQHLAPIPSTYWGQKTYLD